MVSAPRAAQQEGDRAASLAHAVVSRLNQLRTLGPGGESFPVLLDDPFGSVEPTIKPSLLELLVRSSLHQQVILFTEDETIVSWARLEAMTGRARASSSRRRRPAARASRHHRHRLTS